MRKLLSIVIFKYESGKLPYCCADAMPVCTAQWHFYLQINILLFLEAFVCRALSYPYLAGYEGSDYSSFTTLATEKQELLYS